MTNLDEVKCSCGEIFEAELLSAISIIEDPDIKDLLLSGMVNLVQCPNCEKMFYAERFLLYHDSKEELIAFVYPLECQEQAAQYRQKMIEDFNNALDGLSDSEEIKYEPILIFGIEDLVQLLKAEQHIEYEEMILEYVYSQLGIEIFKIKPSLARKFNIPKIIPIEKGSKNIDASSIISALQTLIKYNSNLISYVKLLEKLSKSSDLADKIVKGNR